MAQSYCIHRAKRLLRFAPTVNRKWLHRDPTGCHHCRYKWLREKYADAATTGVQVFGKTLFNECIVPTPDTPHPTPASTMLHQFETQTEPQTSPLTQLETSLPSAQTPAPATLPEQRNALETASASELVTTHLPEEALVAADSETWQGLLEQWRQEPQGKRPHTVAYLSVGAGVLSVPIYLLIMYAFPTAAGLNSFIYGFWLVFLMVAFQTGMGLPSSLTPGQTRLLNALAEVQDTQAAGPLLEAWQTASWGQGREELGKILTGLLPRLRRENVVLSARQREILYSSVNRTLAATHTDFVLVCLDAIERIGDQAVLPTLARFVVHDAPSKQEQNVRERARQCLTRLTQQLDFGTTGDIPGWVAKLPHTSVSTGSPVLPAGADDALIAHFALIQLLPQLQPSDSALLKHSQREYLAEAWRWMLYALSPGAPAANLIQQSRLGSAFSFAVLDALEQIGTGQDLSLSYYLLRDVPVDDLPPLREKARHVNAILEQRRDREQIGQTLLRGASAPPAAPGELLASCNRRTGFFRSEGVVETGKREEGMR